MDLMTQATPITYAGLLRVAYAQKFPHAVAVWLVDLLAQAIYGRTARQCDGHQLARVADSVRDHIYDAKRDPLARAEAKGQRPHEGHRDRIRTLASAMAWPSNEMRRFIRAHCDVPDESSFRTAADADRCIRQMEALHRQRRAWNGGRQ